MAWFALFDNRSDPDESGRRPVFCTGSCEFGVHQQEANQPWNKHAPYRIAVELDRPYDPGKLYVDEQFRVRERATDRLVEIESLSSKRRDNIAVAVATQAFSERTLSAVQLIKCAETQVQIDAILARYELSVDEDEIAAAGSGMLWRYVDPHMQTLLRRKDED